MATAEVQTPIRKHVKSRAWITAIAYAAVAMVIVGGWSISDLRLVDAADGLGYMLGIVGATMMALLMLYPLRKRARFLRNAGAIRHWFRLHMILGVLGPVLVLLHSNFNLGSVNSQVALFCTIVVASSGIVGRYLYAKIHNGLYGNRLTFDSVRTEIEESRTGGSALGSIIPVINDRLAPLEDAVDQDESIGSAISGAITCSVKLAFVRLRLKSLVKREVHRLSADSTVIRDNEKRLLVNTFRYVNYRVSVLRRFAQLQACERLFSLWHVVHYPLFMVLVVAAIVHVIAVHMY